MKLRVSVSHLQEHKFKPSFQDTLNPIWSYTLLSTIKTLIADC